MSDLFETSGSIGDEANEIDSLSLSPVDGDDLDADDDLVELDDELDGDDEEDDRPGRPFDER